MKLSDYVVCFLAEKGITDVFGYPGGMVTHLMDSFDKEKNRIRAHVTYHEQGAAFAACGYAAVANLPGVAYATSGPGATNLMTGIANAYFDSTPCIFLTGQVNTYEGKGALPMRQKGFQEMDVVAAVRSYTKYAVCITAPEQIRLELEKAYFLAMSGRKGPVLLDLPMNIQRQEIEPQSLVGFTPPPPLQEPELDFVVAALNSAKRPCLLIGAGVKAYKAELRALAELLSVPVLSSMLAVDVLQTPHYYGFIGAYGHRAANFILAKSDLIVSLGTRLDGRQVGGKKEGFAPHARLIRFDIDSNELTYKIKPDEQAVVTDLKTALPRLCACAKNMNQHRHWLSVCDKLASSLAGLDNKEPNHRIKALGDLVPDGTVITTDVGQNQVWAAQSFHVKPNQQMLFSGGHGAMGYALPAAIGAHFGSGKPVVCISGDGGLQMNIQELQFIVRENIPIKIVLLNNHALGMIRHFQEMYFDSNYVQTVSGGGYTTPNFEKLAAAYGIAYYTEASAAVFAAAGPAFIEIAIDGDTYVFPKLAMGKPNQDQEPPLDRALYTELMGL